MAYVYVLEQCSSGVLLDIVLTVRMEQSDLLQFILVIKFSCSKTSPDIPYRTDVHQGDTTAVTLDCSPTAVRMRSTVCLVTLTSW